MHLLTNQVKQSFWVKLLEVSFSINSVFPKNLFSDSTFFSFSRNICTALLILIQRAIYYFLIIGKPMIKVELNS